MQPETVGIDSPDSCGFLACDKRATHGVVLLLFAPILRPHPPIEVYNGIRVCPLHSGVTVEEILTDALWSVVCSAARLQGKMEPKRSRSRVRLLTLDELAARFPPRPPSAMPRGA